jgi:hypothetical protein
MGRNLCNSVRAGNSLYSRSEMELHAANRQGGGQADPTEKRSASKSHHTQITRHFNTACAGRKRRPITKGGVCVHRPIPHITHTPESGLALQHAVIGVQRLSSNPSQHIPRHKLYLRDYFGGGLFPVVPC